MEFCKDSGVVFRLVQTHEVPIIPFFLLTSILETAATKVFATHVVYPEVYISLDK